MEEKEKTQLNQDDELKLLLARAIAGEPEEDDELVIDWISLVKRLINGWKTLLAITLIFSLLGLILTSRIKKEYTVTISLSPESGSASTAASLGGMANMLGFGNMSSVSSAGALTMSMFPQISASTPFLISLFDVEVTPYVSPQAVKEGAKPAKTVKLFSLLIQKPEHVSWWRKLMMKEDSDYELYYNDKVVDQSHLTPKQTGVVNILKNAIDVSSDKTGMTLISVKWDDPQIAAQLADTVCDRLQDYVIAYRTKKAKEDYDYFCKMSEEAKEKMIKAQSAYAQSVDYDRSVILQSINSHKERLQAEASLAAQIYQQMETQKAASLAKYQDLKPVFAVVEPATFPLAPSSKSKKVVFAVFVLLGIVLGSGWVMIGSDLCQKLMAQLKTCKEE